MVHVPKDDDTPTGQHRRPPQRPASQPQQRPQTGQTQKPATGQQPQASDRKKTGPVGNTQQKKRSTQLLSLEPPKRSRGPTLGSQNTRLDSMGGPATKSQRNRNLFGTIGREKSGKTDINPAVQSSALPRPTLRKPGQTGPVDLGASAAEVDGMIVRRKGTRRIPKAGGGVEGEAAPLDSMGSGRRPSIDPGPAPRSELPPVVNMPIPQAPVAKQPAPAPDPRTRGNTLAGVSAEDLLGEEGRAVLEKMRQREQQARMAPPQQQPQRTPSQPLPPRMEDSSRMAFHAAEYSAGEVIEEVTPKDELAPQDSFLAGPTRQIQRDVVQTPMPAAPAYREAPPPDDLGYERPVDLGEAEGAAYYEGGGTAEEPTARESAAHDEMEQRAGYLLWLQGVITAEEVEDALTNDEQVPDEIRGLLYDCAFTDQVTLHRFLARHESLSPVDLEQVQPTERALAMLRPAIARAYRVIPIERVGELLLVAAAFPFDPKRLLELRRLTTSKVKLFVVTEEEIDLALMKYYPGGQATLRSPRPPGIDQPAEDDESSVTGEGEALEENYDPTLSGGDSGLYAPVEGDYGDEDAGSDLGLSELEEGGAHGHPIGGAGDLDESTLGGASDVNTDPDLDVPGEFQQRRKDSGSHDDLQTGPEELDPFA
jgi:hypothetical protein